MNRATILATLALPACVLASCTEPHAKVAGSMKFVLGGTSGTTVAAAGLGRTVNSSLQFAPLIAGDEYIVSPRKAKIKFTSVLFASGTGEVLGESTFSDCTVVYDRSLASGSSLLDCAFEAPVGEISEMRLYFDTTVELLVSDAGIGIYSDPASATKYSTTAPAGGASFVPLTITIGTGTTRATPIFFGSPVTIEEGTTPQLYATVDMIHTIQLKVNTGGTTLTPNILTDPVALFGGLTAGSSRYYSGATTVEGYKVQGVPSLRVFNDASGNPLYAMIGPNFCGVDAGSPKGAWASPPIGATVGGWLGRDANNVLAWALATTSAWTTYNAYYVMTDISTIGQTTVLNCKVTTAPPPPADGKTYASGAPALTGPDKSVTLRLLSK